MDRKPARILIVEDHAPSRELLTEYLNALGYEISTAEDGQRAIALACAEWFDLVILDVRIPLYDGIEVLRILRKRHVLRPLRAIAITGDTADEVRCSLADLGIDGYLTKPVDLKTLSDLVHTLIPLS